ncbi:phage tail protein [Mycobacterium sp. Y57]|uniref:phage tail protein n=1 Tax=Mycolicibacterium xanthum TaxID=2796469 RepID=UPI001C8560F9|nr:phage tail protein [Mycolicibacterium xanthum]MBX7432763.1 phage tail protein [Mycolicibacterium xanthum]
MRHGVEGLTSPLPLLHTMPAVYRSDPQTERLCAALDEVLAPVFATLDCLTAYLDPRTTPADMLGWLAGWIGADVDGHETVERQRELIATAIALLPYRGTKRGVQAAVAAACQRPTEVLEVPGHPVPTLVVRVTVERGDAVDTRWLGEIVNAVKPAHIPHRVEPVIGAGDTVAAAATGAADTLAETTRIPIVGDAGQSEDGQP